MKIAILNLTGNVGKTTIARDILKVNNPNYQLISIESINKDGKGDIMISSKQGFEDIYVEVLVNDDLILDIGSSNIEEFLTAVHQDKLIIDSIDLFIIPVTPSSKQIIDTIKTIIELQELNIELDKIKLIFNMADPNFLIEKQFDFPKFKKISDQLIKDPIIILKHKIFSIDSLENLMKLNFDEDKFLEAKKTDTDKARKMALNKVRKQQAESLFSEFRIISNRIMGISHE